MKSPLIYARSLHPLMDAKLYLGSSAAVLSVWYDGAFTGSLVRVFTLLLALLLPNAAVAKEVIVEMRTATELTHKVAVTVGADPSTHRFVSVVPLSAVIEAVEGTGGEIRVNVEVEVLSTRLVRRGLTRKERKVLAYALSRFGIASNQTFVIWPGKLAFAGPSHVGGRSTSRQKGFSIAVKAYEVR